MQFLTSYYWEKGTKHRKNQDSICLQSIMTRKGQLLSACICDGLGGLLQGEVASGYAAESIGKWIYEELMQVISKKVGKKEIQNAGRKLFYRIDRDLNKYGKEKGIELATTVSLLLIWQRHYYIFHAGDSRIYKIGRGIKQLTKDHTLNEQVLTRCLGTAGMGKPDCLFGKVRPNRGYLLCSDGFRHFVSRETLQVMFANKRMNTEEMDRKLREIGKRNMERGEKDNISAIYVQIRRKKHGGDRE